MAGGAAYNNALLFIILLASLMAMFLQGKVLSHIHTFTHTHTYLFKVLPANLLEIHAHGCTRTQSHTAPTTSPRALDALPRSTERASPGALDDHSRATLVLPPLYHEWYSTTAPLQERYSTIVCLHKCAASQYLSKERGK